MRRVSSAIAFLGAWIGCATLQQVGQSAADNARPAAPPVLSERPISSSSWPDDPGAFLVGGRLFAVNVSSDLFNVLSVRMVSGRPGGGSFDAVELPRGSASQFQPIDRAQLQAGKVYFRLTTVQSDANRQIESDILEVLDNASIFVDAPGVVSSADLVVGEKSINPKYSGTADAYRESTWKVRFSRDRSGPPGQGGLSKCTFSFPNVPWLLVGQSFRAPPGARGNLDVFSDGCKAVGLLIGGQPSSVVVLPDATGHDTPLPFQVPANARVGDTFRFQVFGQDLLKRQSLYDVSIEVKAPPPPPAPKPCDTGNGNGGNKIAFTFCGVCGTDRIPLGGSYCTSAEAQAAAGSTLSGSGHANCTVQSGSCPPCPITQDNPVGQPGSFDFCVTCPGNYKTTWTQPACTKDDAEAAVQNSNANCSLASGQCP
ncbi:MAG TPA: hypothetical protein VFL36_10300 [Myxococcales bacterium]|nr:hypothetical protein [Myxococcales bacterium]